MANEEHLAILRQGVEVWNDWRERNSTIAPKLDGANLTDMSLSGINLNGAILVGATLIRVNLTQATLTAAQLTLANLTKANLTQANCVGANLSNANLLGTTLTAANLCRSNLDRFNMRGAALDGAKLKCSQARETDFRGARFTGTCLEGWDFNPDTKFDNVKCLYVYRKGNRQERQPSNRDFEPGEFIRLCQEEQDRSRRRYAQTSVRFEKGKPDENCKKLVKLINSATVEAIFDPYFDDTTLDNLVIFQDFGVAISPEIRVLTSDKVIEQNKRGTKEPRLTKAHEAKTFQSLSTVGEIRLINQEHRRFMLLSGGVSLIIGMSLNELSKNEAASLESDRDDRAFFDSQWSSAQVFN